MNGQFVDDYGYSFRCFRRGELIRPTNYFKQIDESMGSEPTSLHKAEKRRILAQLNARLAELQGGG